MFDYDGDGIQLVYYDLGQKQTFQLEALKNLRDVRLPQIKQCIADKNLTVSRYSAEYWAANKDKVTETVIEKLNKYNTYFCSKDFGCDTGDYKMCMYDAIMDRIDDVINDISNLTFFDSPTKYRWVDQPDATAVDYDIQKKIHYKIINIRAHIDKLLSDCYESDEEDNISVQ